MSFGTGTLKRSRLETERPATKERKEARRLALDILYQAEIREELPLDALKSRREHGWSNSEQPDNALAEGAIAYACDLVTGVQEHSAEIDRLIDRYSDRWALDRMPVVDKNLLRMGIFELLWMPDVPTAVVINEAVELAKSLSTDESGRFVNGILGRIAQEHETR